LPPQIVENRACQVEKVGGKLTHQKNSAMKQKASAILCTLFAIIINSTSLHAQGTAFTYQGRLADNGVAANGTNDFTFAVFATASGGIPVAGPLKVEDVPITNGLFTCTVDFGPGIFTGADRWLEIGVRPGDSGGGYTNLSPRQLLTPAPYAIYAPNAGSATTAATVTGSVPASQITGTLASSNIGVGTITSTNLASGAAAANLAAGGQSGIPHGGVILSSKYNDGNLLAAGYVKLGKADVGDIWERRASGSPPTARGAHSGVWTGSELIVWGGLNGVELNNGGRYNPAANSWTSINTNGAPAARALHTAIWTGTEMIVWGGIGGGYRNDGGRYNPAVRLLGASEHIWSARGSRLPFHSMDGE
jgi:hypothetical protein